MKGTARRRRRRNHFQRQRRRLAKPPPNPTNRKSRLFPCRSPTPINEVAGFETSRHRRKCLLSMHGGLGTIGCFLPFVLGKSQQLAGTGPTFESCRSGCPQCMLALQHTIAEDATAQITIARVQGNHDQEVGRVCKKDPVPRVQRAISLIMEHWDQICDQA